MDQILQRLKHLEACEPGLDWVRGRSDKRAETLWSECLHPDWLLWVAVQAGISRRTLVQAATAVIRTVMTHHGVTDRQYVHLLEVSERWSHGRATAGEVWDAKGEVGHSIPALVYLAEAAGGSPNAAVAAVRAAQAEFGDHKLLADLVREVLSLNQISQGIMTP